MRIFIHMGYVTARKGAKMHLNMEGVAACKSGGKTIISPADLTSGSASKICKHCLERLRTQLIWRRDDLGRRRSFPVSPERREIDLLFDELDKITPGAVEARNAFFDGIEENLRRAATLAKKEIIISTPVEVLF